MFNAVLLIFFPESTHVYAPHVEHGLGPPNGPVHASTFHAIFHQMSTSSFYGPAGNGIARLEVLSVVHPLQVGFQVIADLGNGFLLSAAQAVFGRHLPQPTDDASRLALEHAQDTFTDEILGFLAAFPMKYMGCLPQPRCDMQQIQNAYRPLR